METTHSHTKCRVCGGPLQSVLDLGKMPLANALKATREEALEAERFPLHLMHCDKCFLGQLDTVVEPEVLYEDYVYRSSVAESFREHCAELVQNALDKVHPGISILDIAGNDGCLAREFLSVGHKREVYVVDPAQDDTPADYVKIKKLWNLDTAAEFQETYGLVDIITAQNVVGHVDEIVEFFHAVSSTLTNEGVFIVEVPSYVEMIRRAAFETVYHEHLSYWSVSAMLALAARTGFTVRAVREFPDLHCGTLRFYLTPGKGNLTTSQVLEYWKQETAFFADPENVQMALYDWKERVNKLREIMYRIDSVGVTASAKAISLLNAAEAAPDFLLDDSESKQGKFAPGCGTSIEVFGEEDLGSFLPIILSQNLAEPLLRKLRAKGYRGPVVVV